MVHSDITRMVVHERRRAIVAAAERDRLVTLVRREARAGSLAAIPLRARVRG